MNIIREYSLDQVRKNRRTSVSIIVAVLIASTFLYNRKVLQMTTKT